MSALRFQIRLFILSLLSATSLLAQSTGGGPVPVAEGTPGTFAVGYSYLNMNVGGNPTANLNGLASSATIDVEPRWGASVDSSYVRAGRDPGSGHSSYVLSVLAGPVFYPKQTNNTQLLVRALIGVSLVDGSVRINQLNLYYRGWESRFSWAIGTGVQRNLSTMPFGVRFNVDYLRTSFMSPAAVVRPQNGLRVSASLVFRFGARESTHLAAR
jgi:hypothetical protein